MNSIQTFVDPERPVSRRQTIRAFNGVKPPNTAGGLRALQISPQLITFLIPLAKVYNLAKINTLDEARLHIIITENGRCLIEAIDTFVRSHQKAVTEGTSNGANR